MTLARSLTLALCAAGGLSMFAASAQAATPKLAARNTPAQNVRPAAPPVADGTLGVALVAAQVSDTGTVNFGSGATGAIHIGTGIYEVDFNRDVSGCFYSANSFDNAIAVDLEPRSGNANGVFLETVDNAGTNVDVTFYLTVYCGR